MNKQDKITRDLIIGSLFIISSFISFILIGLYVSDIVTQSVMYIIPIIIFMFGITVIANRNNNRSDYIE